MYVAVNKNTLCCTNLLSFCMYELIILQLQLCDSGITKQFWNLQDYEVNKRIQTYQLLCRGLQRDIPYWV